MAGFNQAVFHRRRRDLTQGGLGLRIGRSQSEVSAAERGENTIVLREIAAFFGVSRDCAHRLLEPVPESLDPLAVRGRVEREFAGQQDRTHRRHEAAARPDTDVPEPPSLSDLIRQSRH